jgi:L-2-hydroxyglutarate oxidase LhgO
LSPRQTIGVIGGGIVGLAVAKSLAERGDAAEVVVLEKEDRVAAHQTGHNSGVVHAGLYYPPGSLKASLCRRGGELLRAYCAERGIPYEECGKLVIARTPAELPRLDDIERRASANGVPGLRRIEATEIAAFEPHARGVAALHSPRTAIVDYRRVAEAMAADVASAGGSLQLGFDVVRVARRSGELRLHSRAGEVLSCGRVVVCAGLQSDRVAHIAGADRSTPIVPFRGEYHRLLAGREHLVRHLIYPVPDPAYPFLGVHFTRHLDGTVDVGPNAVLALAREGYRRRDFSAADVADMLGWPGFRRLARRHWRTGLRELRSSVSKRAFLREAQSFIPELELADLERAHAGVRAQAVERDGSLVEDFRISHAHGVLAVGNAPSPAATSSLAIGDYVAAELLSSRAS